MTAPDYVSQVAELLGKHRVRGFSHRDECACGWQIPDRAGWADRRSHDAHVAEVLAAAGLIPTSAETKVHYPCVDDLDEECCGYRARIDPARGVQRRPCEHAITQTRAVTDWKDATDD